ncbi:MAG: NAD(P)-dependent oxidoreductase [Pyramidobacter sp.]|jgi:3-hydroxyisobutyrate dehydrogenase
MSLSTVAFIGLGIMGRAMAQNLMEAGFRLRVWARRPEKIADMSADAVRCPSVAEALCGADAAITMLGAPDDVRQLYWGDGGILASAAEETLLVDMTTSSPALAQKLSREGRRRGLRVLDAPVTGGKRGAEERTLSIYVGGEREDFEACRPLFEAMGKQARLMGPAGCGQHAKMANQLLVAGTLTGICESLAYARRAGLDLEDLFPLLCAGSGGSRQLEKLGPKIMAGDDSPSFFVRYLAKDLRIAVDEAREAGLNLPSAQCALDALDSLTARGMGERGTQALIHFYEA